jgi:hypothetical protein
LIRFAGPVSTAPTGNGIPTIPTIPVPTLPTTVSPNFSPTPVVPTTAAPTGIALPTTSSPAGTSGPATSVVLSAFSLFYQIEQTRIPSLQDYEELGLLTNEYLDTYYERVFDENDEVVFQEATTVIVGTEFRLGLPVQVNYNSSILFDTAASTFIPSQSDLDAILQSAFSGSNNATYLAVIQTGLQVTNIFSTTAAVGLEQTDSTANSTNTTATAPPVANGTESASSTSLVSTRSTRAGIAGGATIGAVAFLIIGALAIQYRQKRKLEEPYDTEENLISSSSRLYITKIDEDFPTTSDGSRPIHTNELDHAKAELNNRSLFPTCRHDSESLRSVWQSDLLDDHDEQELESSPQMVMIDSTGPMHVTSMHAISSPWVSPQSEERRVEINETDERTVDSSSVSSSDNIGDEINTMSTSIRMSHQRDS